jgi:hypothetical protein
MIIFIAAKCSKQLGESYSILKAITTAQSADNAYLHEDPDHGFTG